MEEVRLQKFFSDAGVMSRRHAESEIAAGRVTVNGITATVGMKIDPSTDEVVYNGARVLPRGADDSYTYIVLNKPAGYVTTMSDESGRPTVCELTRDLGRRVYPVGRLDMYSEGVLIMTDDGNAAMKLMHPSYSTTKVYAVRVKGAVSPETLRKLTSPMEFDGYTIAPVGVKIVSADRKNSRGEIVTDMLFTLSEGRNRQIRKMCEICGLTVVRLRRISEGEISLGNLPSGKWRYLTDSEIEYIRNL